MVLVRIGQESLAGPLSSVSKSPAHETFRLICGVLFRLDTTVTVFVPLVTPCDPWFGDSLARDWPWRLGSSGTPHVPE